MLRSIIVLSLFKLDEGVVYSFALLSEEAELFQLRDAFSGSGGAFKQSENSRAASCHDSAECAAVKHN